MKIKIKKVNSVEKEVEVKLTPEDVAPVRKTLYDRWQQTVGIPGYRRGKAPLELVLRKYKSEIEDDLKNKVVNYFFKKVSQEAGFIPITPPLVKGSNLTPEGGVVFILKIEERPRFKLPKYKGLKVRKGSVFVEEKEVDETLEKLKRDRAQWVNVERDVREGDLLILDLKIKDKGGNLLEEKEDTALLLDKNVLFSELLNSFINMGKDSSKEFVLEVPQEFYDKKIAGKKCHFWVKIKSVKEKKEPLLDDNFAQQIGPYKNLNELRAAIREELENYKNKKVEIEAEEKLIQSLISNTNVELPSQLLQTQVRKVAEDITLKLLYRGVSKTDIEKQMNLIWEEARKEAEKQLKTYFILEEIASKEGIEISQEELEKYIKELAEKRKIPQEEMRKRLEETNEIENLRQQLRNEKALRFIMENAELEITPVNKEVKK